MSAEALNSYANTIGQLTGVQRLQAEGEALAALLREIQGELETHSQRAGAGADAIRTGHAVGTTIMTAIEGMSNTVASSNIISPAEAEVLESKLMLQNAHHAVQGACNAQTYAAEAMTTEQTNLKNLADLVAGDAAALGGLKHALEAVAKAAQNSQTVATAAIQGG